MSVNQLIISLMAIFLPIGAQAGTGYSLMESELMPECQDGIDGLPVSDLTTLHCLIDLTIERWDGVPLRELSQQLIDRVRIQSQVRWTTTTADPRRLPASEIQLTIPPQTITVDAELTRNEPFRISLALTADLHLRGSQVCQLEVVAVRPRIHRLESTLEPWLNEALKEGFNQEPAIPRQLTETIRSELERLKHESCRSLGPIKPPEPVDAAKLRPQLTALQSKYETYLRLGAGLLDQENWIPDTHCDGLLFNSLYAVAGGTSLIELAESPMQPGQYFRHWQQNCYRNFEQGQLSQASKSTISRDMMVGLLLWIWQQQDGGRVQDLLEFGRNHSLDGFPLAWLIGRGQVGRVEISPALMETLYEMNHKLNHVPPPAVFADGNFQVWTECDGYECHLQALTMLLRWQLHGELEPLAMERLRWMIQKEPNNALYASIYGFITRSGAGWQHALQTLLNESWFPRNHLPSNEERCEFYLFQRDYIRDGEINPNWLPCPEDDATHTAVDFLLASWLILNHADDVLN
jgi:hypothetical protein